MAFGATTSEPQDGQVWALKTGFDAAQIPAAPGGAATRGEPLAECHAMLRAAVSHDAARLLGDLLPSLRIQGEDNTDRAAIELVLVDKIPLAVVARTVSSNERQLGAQEHVLGWHVPVLAVHPSNPVRSLSRTELRDLLGGKIQTWARLGGALAKVNLVAPPPGPEADHYAALLMPGDRISKTATTKATARDRLATCASDPTAVAIVSLVEVQAGSDVRLLALSMVPPSAFALSQGKYPAGCAVRLVWKKRDERIEGLLGETRCEPWLSRVAPRLLP